VICSPTWAQVPAAAPSRSRAAAPGGRAVALEQVDEAVIGELRHEHLRHVLERGDDFQRAGQPLADALEQGDPVLLPWPSRLLASRARITIPSMSPPGWRKRHGESPDERARPVAADALERPFPGPSVQHLGGEILRLPHVIFGEQAEGQDRAAGQPATSPEMRKSPTAYSLTYRRLLSRSVTTTAISAWPRTMSAGRYASKAASPQPVTPALPDPGSVAG
jgi:hypothetical protein